MTKRTERTKRATRLSSFAMLCILVVTPAQTQSFSTQHLAMSGLAMNQKQETPPRPPLVPPKRTVSVQSIEVKLTKGSTPTGVGMSIGFGNTSTSGSQSDGEIEISDPQEFASGVQAVMMTSLSESKGFLVVDLGDPSMPTASGTMPPADDSQTSGPESELLLRAVITDMSCRRRSGGLAIGDLSGGQGQFENKVTMDVRLIDPLTNIVVDSVRATGRKTSKNSIFEATKYSVWDPTSKILDLSYKDYEDSALAEATRLATQDAVKKLIEKSQKRPWEARVIKIIEENGELEFYLNVGPDCGLMVGDKLELLLQGDPILDEKTEKIIGRSRPKKLGVLEVFNVQEQNTICKFARGSVTSDIPESNLIVRFFVPQSSSNLRLANRACLTTVVYKTTEHVRSY